jgi:outer membrane biosynthesis protein TonB
VCVCVYEKSRKKRARGKVDTTCANSLVIDIEPRVYGSSSRRRLVQRNEKLPLKKKKGKVKMKTREVVLSGAVVIGILTALFLLMSHLAEMSAEIEEMKEYQRSSVPSDVLDAYLEGDAVGDEEEGETEQEEEESTAPVNKRNKPAVAENKKKTKKKKARLHSESQKHKEVEKETRTPKSKSSAKSKSKSTRSQEDGQPHKNPKAKPSKNST